MIIAAAVLVAIAAWLLTPDGQHARLHLMTPSATTPPLTVLRQMINERGAAEQVRSRVIAALTALSTELDAGQPPALALIAADPERHVWPKAIAALAVDADVGEALRLDGADAEVVRSLAACWTTSARTGAGLAAAVASLAQSARAAEAMRGEVQTQLAGPRATARMLAVLPLLGVGMGQLAGADPIAWLLTTPAGVLCLLLGIALNVVGLLWTRHIAHRVEAEL